MSPIEDNRVCLLGAWNALFSLARLQHGDCALVGEPIFLLALGAVEHLVWLRDAVLAMRTPVSRSQTHRKKSSCLVRSVLHSEAWGGGVVTVQLETARDSGWI